ncbi:GNAT family N-acetyltransferase [Streptomyces sp. NPDC002553]|uniref:GNAT family N-acetyltransferase n=1 Tax=Streptomyces sp. NPDC002553 TaxID=3154417 RepID=UPI00331D8357
MPGDEAALPEEGLSLWLTDWKIPTGTPWQGRRLVALVGQAVAGHLDVHVHPDGQAVKVWMLDVQPDFQRRGLAGLLMDTLYAAYPTAWINHGARTREGTWWWNSYRDPAPQRNVHNRPPAEWAVYFDAVEVASEKAQNAHLNAFYGLDGHRHDVYRYGERLEQEADDYAPHYQPAQDAGLDPVGRQLHGATRLLLPSALHAYVHDRTQDASRRAAALLEHVGHGNLPRTYWNSTQHAAFEDAYHEEIFQDSVPAQPATHLVFTLRLPSADHLPAFHALPASVDFVAGADIAVELAALAWRSAGQPTVTHTAAFTPPVSAAVAPRGPQHASPAYQARYDEAGFRLSLDAEQPASEPAFADRAEEIRAVAERLLADRAERSRSGPPPSAPPPPQQPQQTSPPPAPGRGQGMR